VRGEGDLNAILALTSSDKKKSSGRQQWVLANRSGGVDVTTDVEAGCVAQVVEGLLHSA
jgi:3-dehydroquinate synthetase